MTILRSFWVVMSSEALEPSGPDSGQWIRYYWYCGIMEMNMLNATTRLASLNYQNLIEHSDRHWSCVYFPNRFGRETSFDIYMQAEMPKLINETKTTIYDHRDTDLLRESKRNSESIKRIKAEPDRPGLKKLPFNLFAR